MRRIIKPANVKPGIFPTLARIPGAHLLCVGPLSCLRHGMMSLSQELSERISYLCVSEVEVVTGQYMEKYIEASLEICQKRNPSCLVIITKCQDVLLGTDYHIFMEELKQKIHIPVRYLEVNRLSLYAKQKLPLVSRPVEQLLYDFLLPREKRAAVSVNLIGPPRLDEHSELFPFLCAAGVERIDSPERCSSFEAYQEMAGAHLNLVLTPQGEAVAARLEHILGIPWLPLNAAYDFNRLKHQYTALGEFFHHPAGTLIEKAHQRITQQLRALHRQTDLEITLDGRNAAGTLSLAKWLLTNGFSVSEIQLDGFSDPEPEEEAWLESVCPEMPIHRPAYRPRLNCTEPAALRSVRRPPLCPVGFQKFETVLNQLAGLEQEATP